MMFRISDWIHIIDSIIWEFRISSLVSQFCATRRAIGFFMIFDISKISVFAPPGAPRGAKTEIFQHGKKLFFVKNNFFLAIYCSESFTNVNYG